MRTCLKSRPVMVALASAAIGGGAAGIAGFKAGQRVGTSEVAEFYEKEILGAKIAAIQRGSETWGQERPEICSDYDHALMNFRYMEINWPGLTTLDRIALAPTQAKPELIRASVRELIKAAERAALGETLSACEKENSK